MRATAVIGLTPVPRDTTASRIPVRWKGAVTAAPARCLTCSLGELCLPDGKGGEELVCMHRFIDTQRRVKRGQCLYRHGDPFHSFYAVRSGFFKSSLSTEDGREQVSGFCMGGDLMGMDGINSGQYSSTAVALEDSEVWALPYAQLIDLAGDIRSLLPRFHRLMSREIVRKHDLMVLLGSMTAEQRVAVFLLNLSQRFNARGYSSCEFNLRMSREEIGSYLGIKLETVSRIFSRFRDDGLLGVDQKQIRILDLTRLKGVKDSELH